MANNICDCWYFWLLLVLPPHFIYRQSHSSHKIHRRKISRFHILSKIIFYIPGNILSMSVLILNFFQCKINWRPSYCFILGTMGLSYCLHKESKIAKHLKESLIRDLVILIFFFVLQLMISPSEELDDSVIWYFCHSVQITSRQVEVQQQNQIRKYIS